MFPGGEHYFAFKYLVGEYALYVVVINWVELYRALSGNWIILIIIVRSPFYEQKSICLLWNYGPNVTIRMKFVLY